MAGQSGSWLASPGQRSPSGGDLGLGGCWKGRARWGYPFRCILRKLDAACWTSHLSPRHGREGLRDFVLPASRDSFALRIPPFFPAPPPPSPLRHVCTGIFLAAFTGRSADGRVSVGGRGEGPQKVCFPSFASPSCRAVSSPSLATGNRRPWISPIGAPLVRWCFSLVLFHLHVRTCNFILITCFPLNLLQESDLGKCSTFSLKKSVCGPPRPSLTPDWLLALSSSSAYLAQFWWADLGSIATGGSSGVVDSLNCPEGD